MDSKILEELSIGERPEHSQAFPGEVEHPRRDELGAAVPVSRPLRPEAGFRIRTAIPMSRARDSPASVVVPNVLVTRSRDAPPRPASAFSSFSRR